MEVCFFFKDIFGGSKPKYVPQELNIDLSSSTININGNEIELYCHRNALEKIFGKPSRFRKSLRGEVKYTYTWHAFGIYAISLDGDNIVSLTFQVAPCEKLITAKWRPKSVFSGVITIGGEPWIEFLRNCKTAAKPTVRLPAVVTRYSNFSVSATLHESCVGREDEESSYESITFGYTALRIVDRDRQQK